MKIVALLPAHNEQSGIAQAIVSITSQRPQATRIIVVADNCTDRTEEIARQSGAEVFVTQNNTDKKAGALNQALAMVLEDLEDDDAVFVMDADSFIDPGFFAAALAKIGAGYGACGGTFRGREGGGFVGTLQRNEYARYARDVRRKKGRTLVLTGTATMFAVSTLRAVIEARRSGRLPGDPQVYDTRVLTEDNELTLAVLHLGFKIVAPGECTLTTEVMESWGDLFRQRHRWKRGAIENLTDYGFNRVTAKYWGLQAVGLVGVVVTALYLSSLAYALLATGQIRILPLWIAITVVFAFERIVTVRRRGPAMMTMAGLVIVEMPFDLFLQGTHLKALWDSLLGSERKW